jgi:acyl-coenzyme A synthetase/AMP-(fatty) acid ligase
MPALSSKELEEFINDSAAGSGNFLSRALAISRNPDEPLLFPDLPYKSLSGKEYRSLSLRQLDAVAEEFAAFYHDQGVTPKDVIAVYLDEGIDYLIQYLAITRLGAIAALLNGNLPTDVAGAYVVRIGAFGVMVSADRALRLEEPLAGQELRKRLWIRGGIRPGPARTRRARSYVHEDSDPVLITHSSGTTGFPKAVPALHRAFFHGVKYRLAHPLEGLSRYLCALPLSHNSSIACLAEAIVRGCPICVLGRKDPRLILQAIEDFKPHIVVAFPKQLVDLCRVGCQDFDLRSVRYWRSTGDAAHEPHIRMLTAMGSSRQAGRVVSGSTYIDGLGSSEMGSSLFQVQFDSSSRNHFRCVGKPQPWVTAVVLDEHSHELEANQVGRLGVRSPSLTSGYWNDCALTEKFRERGYWITGDLVYRDTKGNFYHVDRITDCIETRAGPMYSLLTEEHILNRFPEIFDCCVYGASDPQTGQQLAVVQVEILSGKQSFEYLSSLLDRINQHLATMNLPPAGGIVQDLRNETYAPEGVTGKILKRTLRESGARATSTITVRE